MTRAEAVIEMEAGGFDGAQRHTEHGQWVVWWEGEIVMSRDLT